MIIYLIAQVCLIIFNLVNSRIDAYRIMRHKQIAHSVNFGVYAAYFTLLCWVCGWNVWQIIVFCISAFCNRQFTFDIPLNKRRGLKWDYVSTAKPPKALLDRIEVRIWGYDGRGPLVFYGVVWLICLIINFFL